MTAIKNKEIVKNNKKLKKVTKAKRLVNTVQNNDKWKKVKIKGKVISQDGGDFEGLIGLEVLENYDKKLINKSSNKKQKKQKHAQAVENNEKPAKKPDKKEKAAKTSRKRKNDSEDSENEETPTDRFALLRPPPMDDEESELEEDEAVPELVNASVNESELLDSLEGWNGLGVPTAILRALAEKGFKSPTEIQTLTLPAAILGKKDILGAAETGSGKTLAFGIPILTGIMELKERKSNAGIRKVARTQEVEVNFKENRELTPPPEELEDYPEIESDAEDSNDESETENQPTNERLYALVLTPTRELAVQVRDHLMSAAKYTGVKVVAIFGGLSADKQERLLRKRPEIVVATPGRLWELYQQENVHLKNLEDIAFLAIDETDRMVEKGHFEELRSLLKLLNSDENKKKSRQNFVFSATLTLVHDIPDYLQSIKEIVF